MDILLFSVVGVVAGVCGGIFGIGGGVVIVPALVYLAGYSQHKAQGTSLVALLAPVGLLGLMNYYKENNADLKMGAIIAIGFFGGAYLGSKIALGMDPVVLRKAFAVFLVLVAANLFFGK